MAILSVVMSNPAWAQTRIALVVGIAEYQNAPKLLNPANDARAIAQMFKDAGFDSVDLQLNVGNLDFKRAIRKFESNADQADIAVIYYAGHGIEIGGTNYLIPVDAHLARDADADDEAVPLERLVSSAEGARRLRLIILDACRDNPFVAAMKREQTTVDRSLVSAGLGGVQPTAIDTLIAYAAKAGSTAEDGSGEHSPFATAILKDLTVPGLDIRLAFGRVRDDVLKATANRQEPFVYGSLGGGNVALVAAPAAAAAHEEASDDVRADYELVQKIGSPRAWQVFLGTHPTGFYADLAREQINVLTKQQQAAVPPQQPPSGQEPPTKEALEWDKVKGSSNVADLQGFIQRFPNSPLALSAQQQIDALSRAAQEREDATLKAKAATAATAAQKTEADQRAPAQPNSPELVRAAQSELIRLGCMAGQPDGKLESTQAAVRRYLTIEGRPADSPVVTQDLVTELTKQGSRVCPLECKSGEILKGGTCIAEQKPTGTPSEARQHEQAEREKPAQEKPQARQETRTRPSIVRAGGSGGSGGAFVGLGF